MWPNICPRVLAPLPQGLIADLSAGVEDYKDEEFAQSLDRMRLEQMEASARLEDPASVGSWLRVYLASSGGGQTHVVAGPHDTVPYVLQRMMRDITTHGRHDGDGACVVLIGILLRHPHGSP